MMRVAHLLVSLVALGGLAVATSTAEGQSPGCWLCQVILAPDGPVGVGCTTVPDGAEMCDVGCNQQECWCQEEGYCCFMEASLVPGPDGYWQVARAPRGGSEVLGALATLPSCCVDRSLQTASQLKQPTDATTSRLALAAANSFDRQKLMGRATTGM